ncbi:MAG TPA: NUDIX hydrolase [Thermoanaerobaculia bacterium]|nr:NUDIX hydrolase [Thermoanaerobaculia bacterium]
MEQKKSVRVERSSGGLVVRSDEGRPYVAMIATRGKTRWGLPKGAANGGETQEAAAVREVKEETGLDAEILSHLDTIEYFFRAGEMLIHKFVDFYLMAFRGGEMEPQLSEVDDAAWFPLAQAVERSSFPSEKKILERFLASWDGMSEGERRRFS